MITTKKMLVNFDPSKIKKTSSDFLVPLLDESNYVLVGMKSKQRVPMGMVVFVGVELTPEALVERFEKTGLKHHAHNLLHIMDQYLCLIKELKIGQVVELVTKDNSLFLLKPVPFIKSPTKKIP